MRNATLVAIESYDKDGHYSHAHMPPEAAFQMSANEIRLSAYVPYEPHIVICSTFADLPRITSPAEDALCSRSTWEHRDAPTIRISMGLAVFMYTHSIYMYDNSAIPVPECVSFASALCSRSNLKDRSDLPVTNRGNSGICAG